MKCFPACFRSSKQPKHHKSPSAIPSQHQSQTCAEAVPSTESTKQGKEVKPITESKAGLEEELNCDSRKWVIFDSNDEANQEPSAEQVDSTSPVENNEKKKKETLIVGPILDFITPCRAASLNHRYQDCRDSLDEYEDMGLMRVSDFDLDDDDKQRGGVQQDESSESLFSLSATDKQTGVQQEESSESLFSLSIDSRKHVCDAEIGEKEVSSSMLVDKEIKATGSCHNARNRSGCAHSVLNPIENMSQWKEVQERQTPPQSKKHHHIGKENASLEQDIINICISPEPSFNSKPKSSTFLKPAEQEIRVETSLSSWLVETETTPKSSGSNNSVGNFGSDKENSPTKRHGDVPILGAWTVEELKQFSASSSPRKMRSQNPDETPTIGTVGSYWIHTGQQSEHSDSSSSCRVMSIAQAKDTKTTEEPFEVRLERACNIGISEAVVCP